MQLSLATTVYLQLHLYYKFSLLKSNTTTIKSLLKQVHMIAYSIPFLTGVNMGISQFGELYQNPKILGVKFTAGDFYLLERLKKSYPDRLIWAGFDEMMLPAVSLGVDGAIGSTFNVNGIRARQIFNLTKAGN